MTEPTEPDEYVLTDAQWQAVRPLFEDFDENNNLIRDPEDDER